MTLSDTALVAQVITFGSERAFGLLVQRHQEVVRRFLLRLTGGDTMRSDDLAQETFIHAWQGLHSFRQMSGFRTWLLTIAYRAFLDDQRQQHHQPQSLSVTPPNTCTSTAEATITAANQTDTFALRHDIDTALATLSEYERTCIVLQCIEGLSIRDIAAVTAMPENTVKSHLLRGKRNLATYLRRNGYA